MCNYGLEYEKKCATMGSNIKKCATMGSNMKKLATIGSNRVKERGWIGFLHVGRLIFNGFTKPIFNPVNPCNHQYNTNININYRIHQTKCEANWSRDSLVMIGHTNRG